MTAIYGDGIYGAGSYSAEDTTDTTQITAWGFTLDGHSFYVLNLGSRGSYLYDISTHTWSRWAENSGIGLPSRYGIQFFDETVMGASGGTAGLTYFDPDTYEDDRGNIESAVYGGVPIRGRASINDNAIYLTGNYSGLSGKTVQLFTSDDNGNTYIDQGAVIINAPVDRNDEISWRSLGTISAPGRIYMIRDTGGLASIEGLDRK